MTNLEMQKLSIAIVMVLGTLSGLAQSLDTLNYTIEDGYIEKMSGKLVMNLSLNNAYEAFEIRTDNSRAVFNPNAKTNLNYKVNYRFISFGFKFAPDFLPGNGDEDTKGETNSFGLGTALIFKHWFGDINYNKVKGYYLENTADFTTMGPDDPFIQFPDLQFKNFALNVGYSSNPRFSFRNLTSQTERQLKSTGSFIPTLNLRYYTINDKSPSPSTQKSRNIEASIGPGYIYTFVAKERYYLSLGVSGSLGYLNTKLTTRQPTEDITTHQNNLIYRWDGKTGIGYNGNTFYTGIYTSLSGTQYKQENTTVHNFDTRFNFHAFVGIRLDAPEYLNRKVNQIEEKFDAIVNPTNPTN